jgi:hypothetical protein
MMQTVKGYHGEWNMGSPGGWDYQRIAQRLGARAWSMIRECVDPGVEVDFDHPQINPIPGFAAMLLRAHERRFGKKAVHAVILAESETLDVVLENKNFVEYLNRIDGVNASLAGPEHLSLRDDTVCCRGEEATVIFMDFNSDTLVKIGESQDIRPIEEAVRRGVLVNPRGMEPLGAKGLFEALTGELRDELSEAATGHTPWTRRFFHRATTGPSGEAVEDLPAWTAENWQGLILKPAHGYSGHGIFVGSKDDDPSEYIRTALESGDYIVQQLVPVPLWSERSTWPFPESGALKPKEWQTDFRCFITDEGLQGFLARFGGIPTNVGSGGGIQPLAVLNGSLPYREAVDRINDALQKLGYRGYTQIQAEIDNRAEEMGFTYLLGPIKILLRPRLLTRDHLEDLRGYARRLWNDAMKLERLWLQGKLDHVVTTGDRERELAGSQPWHGSPALMVSDGLFGFGAGLDD